MTLSNLSSMALVAQDNYQEVQFAINFSKLVLLIWFKKPII